jgi:3-oxoacyl-[acyl-carrier-protein] synthase II
MAAREARPVMDDGSEMAAARRRRVVITGAGVVSPLGDSPAALHRALAAGVSARKPIELFPIHLPGRDPASLTGPPGLSPVGLTGPPGQGAASLTGSRDRDPGRPVAIGCREAGEIRSFDAQAYVGERNLRPLDRTSRLLVVAAQLALADSGWDAAAVAEREVGLVLGTTFCSVRTIAEFDRRAQRLGPAHASPFEFANSVINAAAGQAAIWHRLRGVNSTIAGGEASGLLAIAQAAELVRAGRSPAVLAGGAEELCFESFFGYHRAGRLCGSRVGRTGADGLGARQAALPERDDGGSRGAGLPVQAVAAGGAADGGAAEVVGESDGAGSAGERPVPFDAGRNGFSLSEGAGLLMLEEAESAAARGATIRAELLGWASAFAAVPDAAGTAEALGRAVRLALGDAAASPAEIGFVSASASGSLEVDRAEALGLAAALGARAATVPVTAIKAMLGEGMGVSGAWQVIDLVETIGDGRLPGIAGLARLEPGLSLAGAGAATRQLGRDERRRVLATAISADGHCAALVLGAPESTS